MNHFARSLLQVVVFFSLFFLFAFPFAQAQNVAITDDANYQADSSAMLDIKSSSKGVLVPRITTAQRSAIEKPATGLLVYDTDFGNFFYYTGQRWMSLPRGGTGKTGDPLFHVINEQGDTVFAVYNDGVQVTIPDGASKGKLGGFAVSGRSANKSVDDNYLTVKPSGTEVFYDPSSKGKLGGFAVSGRSALKSSNRNVFVSTLDSTRIYINQPAKGKLGGFAVSGRSAQKSSTRNFLDLTKENYFIGHEAGVNTEPEEDGENKAPYGLYNSFIGYQAGASNRSGSYNLFLGYRTGMKSESGSRNVLVGGETGYSLVKGNNNTFLGYQAGASSNGSGNVFLGHRAGYRDVESSNMLYIDNSDTTRPLILGDFYKDILNLNASVGIGTVEPINPEYRLTVRGDMYITGRIINKSKSAKPDYVFGKDYHQYYTPLEVDRYVSKHQHLPWVTPAGAEKDGVDLSRMTIETLEAAENIQKQVIELKKENQALRKELDQLREQVHKLMQSQ